MMIRLLTSTLAMLAIAGSAAAQARPAPRQSSPPQSGIVGVWRAFAIVNGLYQATSTDFRDSKTFRVNAEDAQLRTSYALKKGPALDIAGGARIWRQFGVGVGVTRFTRSTVADVSASIPHPFFFSRPRSIAGTADGFSREETAVHLQARALLPISRRLQAMAFGGPSFFHLTQTLATDVHYVESYPYDAATFQSVDATSAKKSRTGFNVGADVEYFFMRNVGVGGTVQFSRATVDLPSASGGDLSVKAGGAQVGVGLRLRF
jgi:opacity protein-like surface antigen